jgi:drug/metabolite transporter (DMT)-like permease
MNLATFFLALISVSLNAAAQIVLRKAMLTHAPAPSFGEPISLLWWLITNIYLWLGLGCYALSIGTWLVVLSRAEVSIAYPLLSIGYIIAAVLSVLLLGESLGPAKIGGIGLICMGVLLITRTA